jgi:hypothetical protein
MVEVGKLVVIILFDGLGIPNRLRKAARKRPEPRGQLRRPL